MSSLVFLRNKKNNRVYVYTNIKSGVVDGKATYSRKCIGHIDENTGEIVPNNTKGSTPNASLKYTGLTDTVMYLSDKIGLSYTLKVTFGNIWKEILTCAIYGLTGNTNLSSIEKWCQIYDVPCKTELNQKYIEELFTKIDEEGIDAFQKIWRKKIKDDKILHISVSPMMSYDQRGFTSMGGEGISDSIMMLDMDVCYGVDTQLPISYTILPSKVFNFEDIIDSEERYRWINPSDILYVLNKEYCEGNNVNVLVVSDRRFAIKLPNDHQLFKMISDNLHDDILASSNYSTSSRGSNFVTTHIIDISGKPCYAHMYYSAEEAEREIGSFLTLIEKCRLEMETNHPVSAHMGIYKKFFDTKQHDGPVDLNSNSIMEHTEHAGMTIILSDIIADPLLAMRYISLNSFAERTFDNIQNSDDHISLKLYLKHNIDARYFIQFITLILKSAIRKCLIDVNIHREYSVEDVIMEINNIAKISISDRKNPITTEINARQKTVLDAIGIQANE